MARKRKRKAVAPHVRRRKARRRRSNPTPVMFANPRGKRRKTKARKRRRSRAAGIHLKGRRRKRVTIYANPRRSRRRRRRVAGIHLKGRRKRRVTIYANPRRRVRRRRRLLGNPFGAGGLRHAAKIMVWGGLGIVTARVGGHLYDQYLQSHLEGGASTGARAWLGKAARLASMAFLTIAVEKGLARAHVGPASRLVFKAGGFAETGRQAIGIVVKQLSPGQFSSHSWALGNPGAGSGYYSQLSPGSMEGLESVDSFLGDGGMYGCDDTMGALENIDSFDGPGRGRSAIRTSHPYAGGY